MTQLDIRPHEAGATKRGSAAAPIILRIDQAAKSYGAYRALEPVSASLEEGEFISLVGPSGCGKTTLLKMCAGLSRPSDGAIDFRRTGSPIRPGHYGFVFQAPALLPWRTVIDNVMLPADILGMDRRAARERARSLLTLVHLDHAADKRPSELSGGMQQRVSIARALLHDPELIFMDEPFGALDAMTREELNLELQTIHLEQRKTILFVTHDIEEAVLLSDRILVMSSGPGRLVEEFTVDLPRPRRVADKTNPEFSRIAGRVRKLLDR